MEVHITKHEGKMSGIPSISTNPLSNTFCQTMHGSKNNGVICKQCYATNLVGFRKSLREHMENNSKILSESTLCMTTLPKYKTEIVRFNSFGEIINVNHLLNVFNICYNNPSTYHVIYTKRMNLFEQFAHMKPENLKVIESNPLINDVITSPRSPAADIVFNVVTPEYLENHPEYTVNCMQACNVCRLCYTRRTTTKFIVELIK
jgi:hypothetical protein